MMFLIKQAEVCKKAKNIDLTLLDKAEKLSSEMAKPLAEANGQKMQDNNLLITRNKAYTFMKKAIDEIRRNGQYAFWKNPQRYKGYISMYHKKQAAKAAKPKAENAAL